MKKLELQHQDSTTQSFKMVYKSFLSSQNPDFSLTQWETARENERERESVWESENVLVYVQWIVCAIYIFATRHDE
jgi:hypothetical protein